MLKLVDPSTGEETVYVDTLQEAGEYHVKMDADQQVGTGYYWKYTTDSSSENIYVQSGTAESLQPVGASGERKFRMITAVFDNLVESEFIPVEERLDSMNVDSVIATTLKENGIDLAYAYGVVSQPDDSLRLAVPAAFAPEIRQSDYRVRLFPLDVFAPPAFLALHFPGRQTYLWRQIGPLLVATVVLMLVIIACFAYTIRTILRQRRFSGLMVDFINNMTHEFKTPISTVSLAAEAIQRPDVLEEPEKVLRFTGMIQNENRRMRNQTDKILQMAALEQDDYELSFSEVDVHDVIRSAVDSVTLHVGNRKGTILSHLDATKHSVRADRVHLTNVVHNLLDNANKYSPDPPEIMIRTFDSNHGVGMRIEDRGIGLRPEDKKRVFEKYFRVPTGNRHDVKGFGLGLSYVKLMVEAHGGTIALNSKLGEGTEVEVILPIRGDGDQS
jgi:two-component system phosphate regulon sensor histidine kinase PhoR